MNLSVIVPSRTRSNLFPCLQALEEHEPYPAVWRVVVDDGVNLPRGARGCWEEFDFLFEEVVRGWKPFVFARNANMGIAAAGNSDVILLNDDALLQTPGGFTAMQRLAEALPEFGIISATTNVAGNPEQLPRGLHGLCEVSGTVAFVCVLIPRRTIEAVGLLDERFTAYGWEDNDYCRRVRMAGLKVGVCGDCFVDHGSLVSTYRGSPHAAGDIRAGGEIYRAKWGDLQ